ncbi:unnamed protein product, partial [marine sediment metagenome]
MMDFIVEQTNKPSIKVVVPVHGTMENMCAYSMIGLYDYMRQKGYDIKIEFHLNESLISRGRCV